MRRIVLPLLLVAVALLASACGAEGAGREDRELVIGAIPDQNPEVLQRQYSAVAEVLGVPVRYVPVTDYTASVTAFRRGDLDMVFFGGLTGVQAANQVPGAVHIAQRDVDAAFRSVSIASAGSDLGPVADVPGLRRVAGRTVTFGSETSTSGR